MHEVEEKRKAWRAMDAKKLERFLAMHMVPVILGPGKAPFLTDHHHLARALHDNGVKSVFTTVIADLHQLDEDAFWTVLDFRAWTHPYDNKGRRRPYSDLPKTIDRMKDDPYRSLAGELRRLGGFAKDSTPFSEFLWADFLRRRIKLKDAERDFKRALEAAMALAKTDDAHYLPGWCAPHPINDKPRDKKKDQGKKDAAKKDTAKKDATKKNVTKKDADAPVGPPKVSEAN
jgi:hypothetical protein